MNIAAIVVTFNRKELLIECLHGLRQQTTPLRRIYIIDNNSSDGTQNLLRDSGYLDDQLFEYHNTGSNLGGAGGFSAGMKIAHKNNHDWYWLMDDDVEPTTNSLEILLTYSHISKCIHPKKIFTDKSEYLWDGKFNPTIIKTTWFNPERFSETQKYVEINYGCFEGMLIHHSIVEKIGIPDKRYFIHTDDLAYGYLASLRTKVIYVKDSIFIKKIKKDDKTFFLGRKFTYLSGFNQYFNLRNHFLLRKTLLEIGTTNRFISYVYALAKFFKLFLYALIVHRKLKDAKMIWWGLLDGLTQDFSGHKRFLK